MARIVVVGGGIAGVAAAYALRAHDVTIVESSARVGGKLRTSSLAEVSLDEGAEQFLVRVPEAVDLVRAVGLGDAVVHPRTSQASVWSRGALHPLPARTMLGVPTSLPSLVGLLRPREVVRAAADLVAPGEPLIADVSVGALLRRRLGDAVVDRLVDPLLGGVYAGRADELSVQATMPALASALASSPSAIRAARASVASAAEGSPVFATLTSGLGALPDAVVAASGATVVTRRTVRRLSRLDGGGFRVVHGATNDEQAIDADAVVVAVPATLASRLLHDLAPVAAAELAAIDYASVAIVSLAYPRISLTGSGFLVPAVEGRAVKAATFASRKWTHLDGGDVTLVRCSFGRAGEVDVLQRDDADLVALAARELTDLAGLPVPIASRVSRWGGGLPQYAVGHVERVRRIRAAVAAVPGLAVCGAAYDGIGVPACIRSGYAAAAVVGGAA